jgi:hypothetical protein
MSQINHNRARPAAAAALVLVLSALLLTACGGSSKSSSSSASASTTATAPGKGGARNGARFTALRECLQKNGITLPQRTPGQGRKPGSGGVFKPGAGAQLPKGVTQAQLQTALKKCGGSGFVRARGGGGAGGTQRYAKFAACMSKNGVKLPAPNTSGKGPIFNTKGLDTSSSTFKAAEAKCMTELRPPGAGGAGPGGAPGAPSGEAGAGGAPPAE